MTKEPAHRANRAKAADEVLRANMPPVRRMAQLAPLARSPEIRDLDVALEERAAILEFEAGYSRPMAETLARLWARSEWRGRE